MAGTARDGLGWRFERAIVRRPGRSVVDGLRAEDRGAPDHARYRREHARYVQALAPILLPYFFSLLPPS